MIKAKDIHVIQKGDRYVVFHPESLSLFSVSKEIGEILICYENNFKYVNQNMDNNIDNILKHLSENINKDSAKDLKWTDSIPKALSLLISQDCNLRCGYCYADHGTFGHENKLMSYNTAKKCIDKLFSKDDPTHISFLGGEPLLNFHLIKKIDNYLNKNKLNVIYSMITNGTILNNEIKNFVNEKFLDLHISLDGSKEINDVQRFGGDCRSVHDCVAETLNKLDPRNYPITIKSTITRKNAKRLPEIINYISSLNIDFIDIRSVKDIPPNSEFFINDDEFVMYLDGLAKVLINNVNKAANGEKVKMISVTSFILMLIITKTRWIYGCAAGRGLITITANGDVYPCEKYYGLNEFYMGNVYDDDFPGEKFKRLMEMFRQINIYNSAYCKACWARYLCGGVCHWRSYISHKDLSRPSERRCMEIKTILDALLPEIAEIFLNEEKTKKVLNSLKLKERLLYQCLK